MKKLATILGTLAIVIMAATSCGPRYNYETVPGDPTGARIYTLTNGLKVYLAPNHETPRIQTYIAVKVGGKNDPAETTGMAHYFEHLMFKGTPGYGTIDYEAEKPMLDEVERLFEMYRVSDDEAERAAIYRQIDSISYIASGIAIPNEYDKLMTAIGANGTNAYTGYDMTVYTEDIPANQIENWARIQADRFSNPVIRGFHTELETIYEEKNMSLTQDSRKVSEQMLGALFPTHPYGTQTILGSQEHLKNPSITNVRQYHADWYVPNNMAVCMSGDFDPDTTIVIIDKWFGGLQPNNDIPVVAATPLPQIDAPIVREVIGLDAENVTVAWRVGGANSTDTDVMSILGRILYNGTAGLFDLDLIQQQKVLSAYSSFSPMADHGMLVMQGRPKAGQTLDEVKDLMMAEMEKLKAGDFDDALIAATINNYKAQEMSYLDSNYGRADAFVSSFINDVPWERMVNELDRIGRVTKQEIMAFANSKFRPENCAVIYKREGKDPNELKMPKPPITPIQTNRDTMSVFLAEIQNTPVTPIEPVWVDFERDLDILKAKSDIEVLYKKNETTDIFTLQYMYETGVNNDPALALASSYLSYLGTADMTAEEFAAEFYNIACSWGINSSEDRSYVTISGLGENMARAMELTEKLIAGAVPDEQILAGLKADMIKSRADAKLNQSRNFGALQNYAIRGPEFIDAITLSDAELNALTSEELLGKIRALMGLRHRIIYYGAKDHVGLLADIEAHHNVPATLAAPAETVKHPYMETPSNSVVLAEYDAAQIYYIQYSNRGDGAYDPAIDPPLTLYNAYFGGGMNAIVFQEMREARGLAYSASASLQRPSRLDRPYYYMAFIATQNDKLVDAASAFDDIINNMPESEAAFQLAKESIITDMRTQRIIKSSVIGYYLSAQDMGLDYDRRRTIWEQVPSMTFDDVKAFQQKWVAGRPYTFAILGRSADLDQDYLRTLGPIRKVTQEDIFGY
ncbi:MAG: insulinase family protein [Alistipes sp.]|jgi:predicted Zn-dependent peptidase|nr:insulinase family protein [Alistipes sp.]